LKDLKVHLRFSSLLLRIVILFVLAGGAAFTPMRLVAQQAAATSSETNGQGSAAPESAKPDSGLSEEEQQNQAFRLEGPVVKWTAQKLNLSPAITARIYEILNFAIIAFAVGIPLFRWLPKFLRNRKEKLRSDIESAKKVTADATARLKAVEAKLASLDGEIQKFRTEVEAESLQDEKKIKASLGEESARIVQAAEQEIGQAAAQARRGLRNFAADLAIEKAASELVLTPETDRALIAEFVGDMARNGGGKN
jgi:F-type H+-transporting ATPase subunit b